MQNSIWKLAALAAVVGVGFLVVLQAQRGLNQAGNGAEKAEFDDFEEPNPPAGSPQSEPEQQLAGAGQESAFGQYEPPVQEWNEPDASTAAADGDDAGETGSDGASDHPLQVAAGSEPASDSGPPSHSGPQFEDPPAAVQDGDPFAMTPPADEEDEADGAGGSPPAHVPSANGGDPSSDPFAATEDAGLADGPQPESDTRLPSRNASASSAVSGSPPEIVPSGYESEPADVEMGHEDQEDPQSTVSESGPQLFNSDPGSTPQVQDDQSEQDTAQPPFGPGADSDSMRAAEESPFMPRPDEATGASPAGSAIEEFPVPHDQQSPETDETTPSAPLMPDPDAFDSSGDDSAGTSPQVADTEPPATTVGNTEPETAPAASTTAPASDDVGRQPTSPEPAGLGAPAFERSRPPAPQTDARRGLNPERTQPLDPGLGAPPDETGPPRRLTPSPKAAPLLQESPSDSDGETGGRKAAASGRPQPTLSIVKTAPENAVLGEPFVYDIRVHNTGHTPARQVVVEDRVPKGARLVGTIPQAEMLNDRLIWRIGTVPPRAGRSIRVKVVPLEEGQIGSVATVNFVSEVASRTVVAAPKLKLELRGPARVGVGERVTFRFKVSNVGTAEATGVFIRNIIPDGLKHPGGNDLEYKIGTLAAGQSREVALAVVAAEPGAVVNKAILTAEGDLATEATAEIEVVGSPLAVTRLGPQRRYLGRSAVYTNRITNRSSRTMKSVTVLETIPEGLQFVEAGNGGQYDSANRTVAWQFDRLPPGKTKEVKLVLSGTAVGPAESTVTAVDSRGGRAVVKSHTQIVGYAALSTELAGGGTPLAVGETFSLRLRVRNRGSNDASGVKLHLQLPTEVQFVSSEGAADPTVSGDRVSFESLDGIGAGKEKTVTVVLKGVRPGQGILKIETAADHLTRPATREEPIVVTGQERG